MTDEPARVVRVYLTEGEFVAERGTRNISWWVKVNDGWVHVSAWPGAEVERRETQSGTVWENSTCLAVPPGQLLRRVETGPPPYVRKDALGYLTGGAGAKRRVLRAEYKVSARGDLIAVPR